MPTEFGIRGVGGDSGGRGITTSTYRLTGPIQTKLSPEEEAVVHDGQWGEWRETEILSTLFNRAQAA